MAEIEQSTSSTSSDLKPSVCATMRQVGAKPDHQVVVCNETCCDDKLSLEWPQDRHQVFWLQSTISGKRFELSELKPPSTDGHSDVKIKVNLQDRKQEVFGFGGAFTDAFGAQLDGLSLKLRDRLLRSYFGPDGLQYSFGRVPIGGSDFSVRAYTYDDTKEADYQLNDWKLAQEDIEFKMPYISKASALTEMLGEQLRLIASPWSPPAWMKTNKKLVRGYLIDEPRIYEAYANYLIRFLESYENNGITFWAMTVQNEPVASYLPFYFFNSLQFGSEQMAKFLGHYLGPKLEEKRNWTREDGIKIIVGDDSLMFINTHVPALLSEPEAAKYASGLAFHWYMSGTLAPYAMLTDIYERVKDKIDFVVMSEACTGSIPFSKKVDLGSWQRGEAYACDIIEDFERHTNAWIDWNMALDTHGGPNWAQNFVDSPIIVDTTAKEFLKQPMYYAIAHFSRLMRPRSRIVGSKVISLLAKDLVHLAAVNEETGHLVVTVINKSASSKRKLKLTVEGLVDPESGAMIPDLKLGPIKLEPKSFNSFIIKL